MSHYVAWIIASFSVCVFSILWHTEEILFLNQARDMLICIYMQEYILQYIISSSERFRLESSQ